MDDYSLPLSLTSHLLIAPLGVDCKSAVLNNNNTKFKWLTNPYSTNRFTIIISCISLLISSYMFQHNCHHQAADTCIATNYSNAIFLHC